MILSSIIDLYRKFRLITYKDIFNSIQEKDGSLSATEAFSADIINLLEGPTVTQFAEYIGISQPNATYKINNLAAKGYVIKVHAAADKRECKLLVSDKFKQYYSENLADLKEAVDSLQDSFTNDEILITTQVLNTLLDKLKK